MSSNFRKVLTHIQSNADSEFRKGRMFERLMKAYFQQDRLYQQQFSKVELWSEWASAREGFTASDNGIDLVATRNKDQGYCAIQCKCYAQDTRISKRDIDSFISESSRAEFTQRIIVDTGDEWGRTALNAISKRKPPCSVIRFADLEKSPINWPDLVKESPEKLSFQSKPLKLLGHQKEALNDVIEGFKKHSKGKLIMACGTGKTLTSLRIAEKIAGEGGRVLYLVPSISLFQQSMREWAEQGQLNHRYIGICSDKSAGQTDEDASILELEIPVTTDATKISSSLQDSSNKMTVVFSTYHSLALVENAQKNGSPDFDLIICDEAHRTTGIDLPKKGKNKGEKKTSPFVLVHDHERIRSKRRLFMTATPKLYTEGAKTKAASHGIEVFSMDDENTYGPEFHRLTFSNAVESGLLSDYKVVVFATSEAHTDHVLQSHMIKYGGGAVFAHAQRHNENHRVLEGFTEP